MDTIPCHSVPNAMEKSNASGPTHLEKEYVPVPKTLFSKDASRHHLYSWPNTMAPPNHSNPNGFLRALPK
eukprot:scaffold265316_cov31-Attheya_sp.AAC.1